MTTEKEYIFACKLNQLVENKAGLIVELDYGVQAALFLHAGNLFCVSNYCPHQHHAKIHDGFVSNGTVQCPMHGWKFSLETGENLSREGGNIDVYNVKVIDDNVYIEKPIAKKTKWSSYEL